MEKIFRRYYKVNYNKNKMNSMEGANANKNSMQSNKGDIITPTVRHIDEMCENQGYYLSRHIPYNLKFSTKLAGSNAKFSFLDANYAEMNIGNEFPDNTIALPSSVQYFTYWSDNGSVCEILGGINIKSAKIPIFMADQLCLPNIVYLTLNCIGDYIDCGNYKTKKINNIRYITLQLPSRRPVHVNIPAGYHVNILQSGSCFSLVPGRYKIYGLLVYPIVEVPFNNFV